MQSSVWWKWRVATSECNKAVDSGKLLRGMDCGINTCVIRKINKIFGKRSDPKGSIEISQSAIACSKLTTETLRRGVKYVQS